MPSKEGPLYKIQLPPLHPGQLEIAQSEARYKVVDAGRRWGKTSLGVATAVGKAALGGTVWWVAPSFPIALIGWRLAKAIGLMVPNANSREAERRLEFPTGGSLTVKSAVDPDGLRGEGLDYVVLDEAAYIKEVAWTHSIRPALADKEGDAMFISTPNGRNWFWTIWDKAHRHVEPGWDAWKKPTSDNPYIKPDEIELARKGLSEIVFLQEFMAEFVEDAGTVFRGVTDAAVLEPLDEPDEDAEYVFGVDWAKYKDWTVITVLDLVAGDLVAMNRFSQVDLSWQMAQLRAMYNKWQPRLVNMERNQAEKVVEDLKREGIPINPMYTTVQLKNKMINDLSYAFSNGDIKILNDPTLISELRAFTPHRLPSGMFRYGAPSGQHDDCVMSLALAWQAKAQPRGVLMRLL